MIFNILNTKTLIEHYSLRDRPLIDPRGRIICVQMYPHASLSPIYNKIVTTKKYRGSEQLETIEIPKDNRYTITGLCLNFRKRGLNSSFTIRNVLTLVVFEMKYPVFSHFISSYSILTLTRCKIQFNYKRASLYSLRKQSPVLSRVVFDYITDNIDDVIF